MITLEEWMKLVNYKISEGDDYWFAPYGPHAHHFSSWNGKHEDGGYSICIIFDRKDQTVYQVEAHDYANRRSYRIINSDYREEVNKIADANIAWDDIKFTDLELDNDWLEKANAIINGEEYDDRIQININLDNDEMLKLFNLAHEADMTFNDYVNRILREEMDRLHKQS